MSESTKWNIQGSRVYGAGRSFNCTNNVTAKDLYCTLNEYEKTVQTTINTEQQLDKIQKGVIQLQMSLTIVQNDLNRIKEVLNESTNR